MGKRKRSSAQKEREEKSSEKKEKEKEKEGKDKEWEWMKVEIVKMEKKLEETMKSKGTLDASVRSLRGKLRDCYESILLNPNQQTDGIDAENSLWRLHYKGIDEFREKIRKLCPSRGKRPNDTPHLDRLQSSFRGFLDETSGYFSGLILKIRANSSLPPFLSPAEGLCDNTRPCALLCQRFLVSLGDLARYKETFTVSDPSLRDWTLAASYYHQASSLNPDSGFPHNQLAALAIYRGDDVSAIYHYCRSFAVNSPFPNSRGILISHLEKRKPHICKVPSDLEGSGQLFYLIDAVEREHSLALQGANFRKVVWGCFQAHLLEMLHASLSSSCLEEIKVSLSKSEVILEELSAYTAEDLHKIFKTKELNFGGVKIPHLLHVLVILIFFVYDLYKEGQHIIEESHLFLLSRYLCHFVLVLLNKAKCSPNNAGIFMPSLTVFFEWIISQKSLLEALKSNSTIAIDLFNLETEAVSLVKVLLSKQRSPDKYKARASNDLTSTPVHQNAAWEDYELLGFLPLSATHQDLNFSNLWVTRDVKWTLRVYLERFKIASNSFKISIGSKAESTCSLDLHERSVTDTKMDKLVRSQINVLGKDMSLSDNVDISSLKHCVQRLDKSFHSPTVSDEQETINRCSIRNEEHEEVDRVPSVNVSLEMFIDHLNTQPEKMQPSLNCDKKLSKVSVSNVLSAEKPLAVTIDPLEGNLRDEKDVKENKLLGPSFCHSDTVLEQNKIFAMKALPSDINGRNCVENKCLEDVRVSRDCSNPSIEQLNCNNGAHLKSPSCNTEKQDGKDNCVAKSSTVDVQDEGRESKDLERVADQTKKALIIAALTPTKDIIGCSLSDDHAKNAANNDRIATPKVHRDFMGLRSVCQGLWNRNSTSPDMRSHFKRENPVDSSWLDAYTHVKPTASKENIPTWSSINLLYNSKNIDYSFQEILAPIKRYNTKNPFVKFGGKSFD